MFNTHSRSIHELSNCLAEQISQIAADNKPSHQELHPFILAHPQLLSLLQASQEVKFRFALTGEGPFTALHPEAHFVGKFENIRCYLSATQSLDSVGYGIENADGLPQNPPITFTLSREFNESLHEFFGEPIE